MLRLYKVRVDNGDWPALVEVTAGCENTSIWPLARSGCIVMELIDMFAVVSLVHTQSGDETTEYMTRTKHTSF